MLLRGCLHRRLRGELVTADVGALRRLRAVHELARRAHVHVAPVEERRGRRLLKFLRGVVEELLRLGLANRRLERFAAFLEANLAEVELTRGGRGVAELLPEHRREAEEPLINLHDVRRAVFGVIRGGSRRADVRRGHLIGRLRHSLGNLHNLNLQRRDAAGGRGRRLTRGRRALLRGGDGGGERRAESVREVTVMRSPSGSRNLSATASAHSGKLAFTDATTSLYGTLMGSTTFLVVSPRVQLRVSMGICWLRCAAAAAAACCCARGETLLRARRRRAGAGPKPTPRPAPRETRARCSPPP